MFTLLEFHFLVAGSLSQVALPKNFCITGHSPGLTVAAAMGEPCRLAKTEGTSERIYLADKIVQASLPLMRNAAPCRADHRTMCWRCPSERLTLWWSDLSTSISWRLTSGSQGSDLVWKKQQGIIGGKLLEGCWEEQLCSDTKFPPPVFCLLFDSASLDVIVTSLGWFSSPDQ